MYSCADPETFARGGPTLTKFFIFFYFFFFIFFYFFNEGGGGEDPNSTEAGHHRLASETPFNGQTLNARLVAL